MGSSVIYGFSIRCRDLAEKRCSHIRNPDERRVCIEREYNRLFRW